jgi:hypothetical protein
MTINFVTDFGLWLGSLGFTPIYDGLKTSWITSIHDENVNTSREVICDAQSMTKWNFVIDAILWRKLDDPWRKTTVIDHKVFCSVLRICTQVDSDYSYPYGYQRFFSVSTKFEFWLDRMWKLFTPFFPLTLHISKPSCRSALFRWVKLGGMNSGKVKVFSWEKVVGMWWDK